jgi:predicted ATPase/DNA-binding winged helix-turn-helix (wHTH) protein
MWSDTTTQRGLAVDTETFSFGSFRLVPTERRLFDGDRLLRLGDRAFDLLVALVERAGKTVGVDELISRVWPDTAVDQAVVRVNISALRKTLGDGRDGNRFIVNVPRRGYTFVASATRERVSIDTIKPVNERGSLAWSPSVVGRADVIGTLMAQLTRRRLVTIVGPGGIGKTTVAAAVFEAARTSYADGAWFVGLASLSSSELVLDTLAATLGISLSPANPIASLTRWLASKHALIVFDNCEHVIGAVATFAVEMVKADPRLTVLATSREALRTEGEWRYRLAPLAYPPSSAMLSVTQALMYPAVQLLNERAVATTDEFAIAEDDVPAVVQICRRLDGVPLALELVASHLGALGVKELAARLDDQLALLIKGRRTALPRHQTLRATLDWSVGLLPVAEQVILRRLGVFRGDFTMAAAIAVAGDSQLTTGEVVDGVANLVDKSLVVADIGGEVTWYHLLELTRAYTLQKLRESGEYERVARLLAESVREAFVRSGAGAVQRSKSEWFAQYGRQIDNVRAALEWAFLDNGDTALGVALAAAATNFWSATGLLNDCCDWGLKAVAQLGVAEGTRDEVMLQCGLGQALTYSRGMQPAALMALTRALAVAEALSDVHYQLRALYALWLYAIRVCDLKRCLTLVAKCEDLTTSVGDSAASVLSDFVHGLTRYFLAEHSTATADLQRLLARYPTAMRGADLVRFGADLPTCALSYQAAALWSLGFVEKSFTVGDEAIGEGRRVDHPASRCISLIMTRSIIAVKTRRLDDAERVVEELLDLAEQHWLTPYYAVGICAKGGLAAAKGNLAEAERLLRLGLSSARDTAYMLFDAYYRGELAAVLASMGRVDESLVEIDAALRQAESSHSFWCMPELLRLKGTILDGQKGAVADAAEVWFIRSRDLANHQGSLSWELRAAMSLARYWSGRGRAAEAYSMLDTVRSRFTEGFDSADLRSASSLLAELS